MSMMRNKTFFVMLIALLCAVAVANAASGIPECPPKKCCCSTATMAAMPGHTGSMDMLDQTGPVDMGMEVAHACAPTSPKKAMPCCDLESDVQPIELAISTVSNSDQNRHLAAYLATDIHIDIPLIQARTNILRDAGWPKILKVPIFLQTLSILC